MKNSLPCVKWGFALDSYWYLYGRCGLASTWKQSIHNAIESSPRNGYPMTRAGWIYGHWRR